MNTLSEVKTIMLDAEEKRRSFWSLYACKTKDNYLLKSEKDPDFVGLSSYDDSCREFFKLMFIFQQVGVSVTYNKTLKTTMLGYRGKVVILQKDKNHYHVVRGNRYIDITNLVTSLYNDIKAKTVTIMAARKSPAIAERLYGLQTIFFDPWKSNKLSIS